MKKVLALVLALLMLLPVLVACGGDNGSGNETTTEPSTTTKPTTPGVTTPTVTDTSGNEPVVTDPPKVEHVYPDKTYGGSFRVLSKVNFDTATAWGNYEIVYKEDAGLVATELKEAIRNRNDQLKNELGVDIEQINGTNDSSMYTTVQRSVARGNDEFDMVIIKTEYAAQLAQKGHVASIQDGLKYIDADADYYDQRAMDQLSIKGKNYFFVSDITVVNVDATWLFYFNVDLIDEYKLENPYDLLADGNWTIDKLLEMAEKATSDNGDDVWTKDDNWGIAGHGFIPTSMFFGAGMQIAKADETGKITLTMNDSRISEFMQKATQILPYWARYSIHGSGEPFGFVAGDNYNELTQMYAQGRTLFMGEVLAQSRDSSLGAANEDLSIGMLPTPKLNKEQAEYYTPVTSSVATVTCVPITACGKDLDKASHIIDRWAAISETTVMNVYIEQCQKSRYVKDPISPEVIETIFGAISYDLGDAFGWGGLTKELQIILYEGDTDFASMYKSKAPAAQTKIDEFIKAFK
ncbi:MAG: extracellular solute-binding protein [Clostridia bacterium]|nr:extracellular solute-binding protein [Clostridia bacterium]